jgi:hypothetical protein
MPNLLGLATDMKRPFAASSPIGSASPALNLHNCGTLLGLVHLQPNKKPAELCLHASMQQQHGGEACSSKST